MQQQLRWKGFALLDRKLPYGGSISVCSQSSTAAAASAITTLTLYRHTLSRIPIYHILYKRKQEMFRFYASDLNILNCQLLCKQKEQVTAMACCKTHKFINNFKILNSIVKTSDPKLVISFEQKGNEMCILKMLFHQEFDSHFWTER